MNRPFWTELARRGLRAPLVTDLFVHETPDPEITRRDGSLLAPVIARAAAYCRSPLALPLMDLRLDKADLVAHLGIRDEAQADTFHLTEPLDPGVRTSIEAGDAPLCEGSIARDDALRIVAGEMDLFPIGLVIGPFSLATKLLADPITAAALLARGVSPDEEPCVRLLLDALAAAEIVLARAASRQIGAGARALVVCEPTASTAYLSPRQIEAGSSVFDQLVIEPNLRLRAFLEAGGADLFFHDCGSLTDPMVRAFGHTLHPAVLSLGSSRTLWRDAAQLPADVVLYGNLPTKSFYSDAVMPVAEVERRTAELLSQFAAIDHPFILGSECDILHVPDAAATIRHKVDAILAV